jgi:hypothetical protein
MVECTTGEDNLVASTAKTLIQMKLNIASYMRSKYLELGNHLYICFKKGRVKRRNVISRRPVGGL